MSAVLGWSSSSNLALVVLGSWFEKWEIKLELHTQPEVKPTAVHRNWAEALKSLILISAKNRETFVTTVCLSGKPESCFWISNLHNLSRWDSPTSKYGSSRVPVILRAPGDNLKVISNPFFLCLSLRVCSILVQQSYRYENK